MTSGGLYESIFTTDQMADATSDRAWLAAMLQFESALAVAEAAAGVVPSDAADEIVRCVAGADPDPVALGRAGRLGATPVIPLVEELRAGLPADVARWLHHGATSQDTQDTALMLVLRRVVDLVLADMDRLAEGAAALSDRYRSTPMAARTLLQQALPTTFGAKAAGWLVAAVEARRRLLQARPRLAVQLGGAAGTLAVLQATGPSVVDRLAAELDLAAPVIPWHTDRTRVADIACSLALSAGVAAKIGLDVSLLMQSEVAEAFEPSATGRGGSSALPHKRNPAMSAAIGASSRRAQALVAVLLGAMAQEHERSAGAWHSEWLTVTELARAVGGAVGGAADLVGALEVDPEAMARNLGITRGLILAERATVELAPRLGHGEARRVVESAAKRAASSATSLEEELRRDEQAGPFMSELPDDLFDPRAWLGSAETFVDRALAFYRDEREHR